MTPPFVSARPALARFAATAIGKLIGSAPFVTETDEQVWNDCTVCSGLMAAIAMGVDVPPNRPEREALRAATGDTDGGVGLDALNVGLRRRYGIVLDRPATITWADVDTFLSTRGGVVAQLVYRELGSPFTRWDPAFAARPDGGYHAVYLAGANPTGVFLMDPLGRGSYAGEWVPKSRVRAAMEALSPRSLLAGFAPVPELVPVPTPTPTPTEARMARFISTSGYNPRSSLVIDAPRGTKVYGLDGELIATMSTDSVGVGALPVFGLVDAHTGQYLVALVTGATFADRQRRPVFVVIQTNAKPRPAPAQ